eukprot:TRINITY_DN382_c0_g1_i2.p1 TRINITY_DN382_c0_g1~~TRINITY_DN382_c0_g1_i2.p1  ORF type:complete len:346 (-),score=65.74 TRINITY_DN382_c0_g1_i2:304-1341(-)
MNVTNNSSSFLAIDDMVDHVVDLPATSLRFINVVSRDVVNWSGNSDAGLDTSRFMQQHWEIPIVLSILYVIVVFGIKFIMHDRKPFSLKTPLILWNALLALFSIVGFCYAAPAMYRVVMANGFEQDMCGPESESANPWVLLFCLSKIPELIDTVFIVLRKRPLIFLHWYHHILTMVYCWDAWATRVMNGGSFATMNLGVHSIMYSYYAATAAGMRFSKPVRQSITSLQILQMVGGTVITCLALGQCSSFTDRARANLWGALAMYISYWVLFVHYFINAYLGGGGGEEGGPRRRPQQQKPKEAMQQHTQHSLSQPQQQQQPQTSQHIPDAGTSTTNGTTLPDKKND